MREWNFHTPDGVIIESKQIDYEFESHGTIVLCRPLNDDAKQWLKDTVMAESWQWAGDALVVEPRYAHDLAANLRRDGYVVSPAQL